MALKPSGPFPAGPVKSGETSWSATDRSPSFKHSAKRQFTMALGIGWGSSSVVLIGSVSGKVIC